MTDLPHLQDTFVNRTALDPTRSGAMFSALMGYPEGTPISVTYFHNADTETNFRSRPTDVSLVRNPVHNELLQINNFELRMTKALDYSYDQENGVSEVTGEVIFFPGFEPKNSDTFLYSVGNGQIGLFAIASIQRMSFRQSSYHRATIRMRQYATQSDVERIQQGVDKTVVFDKQRFLSGDIALLEHEDYLLLKDITAMRAELIRWYLKHFFSEDAHSILHPEGGYDPYLVTFLNSQISIRDCKVKPVQLVDGAEGYEHSFWEFLINGDEPDLKFLHRYCTTQVFRVDVLSILVNYLVNRPYLQLVKEMDPKDPSSTSYVFGEDFYLGLVDQLDGFTSMVYTYMTTREVKPAAVMKWASQYRLWDPSVAFYNIPILIHLLREASRSIG